MNRTLALFSFLLSLVAAVPTPATTCGEYILHLLSVSAPLPVFQITGQDASPDYTLALSQTPTGKSVLVLSRPNILKANLVEVASGDFLRSLDFDHPDHSWGVIPGVSLPGGQIGLASFPRRNEIMRFALHQPFSGETVLLPSSPALSYPSYRAAAIWSGSDGVLVSDSQTIIRFRGNQSDASPSLRQNGTFFATLPITRNEQVIYYAVAHEDLSPVDRNYAATVSLVKPEKLEVDWKFSQYEMTEKLENSHITSLAQVTLPGGDPYLLGLAVRYETGGFNFGQLQREGWSGTPFQMAEKLGMIQFLEIGRRVLENEDSGVLNLLTVNLNDQSVDVCPIPASLALIPSTVLLLGGEGREPYVLGVSTDAVHRLDIYRLRQLEKVGSLELSGESFDVKMSNVLYNPLTLRKAQTGHDLLIGKTKSGRVVTMEIRFASGS